MRVAVTGATGVIGTSAVRALVAAGHQVIGLARTQQRADALRVVGAEAASPHLFDHDALVSAFAGCDAVCSLATHIPVGYSAVLPGAWRENDRLRTEGVRAVVAAAREAGVRRIVQESVSFLYADNGDDWINEESTLEITGATEPASVGESHVQDYQCLSRHGVVLRFGVIVGDDAVTRWTLKSAQNGGPLWSHVVHTDDIGLAVVAALGAPSGVYNVGAEPVRRADLVQGFADAFGHNHGALLGGITERLARTRIEPMTRSLRVSSEHFTAQTGWTPRRSTFDTSWFDGLEPALRAAR